MFGQPSFTVPHAGQARAGAHNAMTTACIVPRASLTPLSSPQSSAVESALFIHQDALCPPSSLSSASYPPDPEKAMAPHSSTLAWKIPWMEEPGGLPSMGSHSHNSGRVEWVEAVQWVEAGGQVTDPH